MELICKINEDYHIVPENLSELKFYLDNLKSKDNFAVSIKKHIKKRSDRQNRWYWGVAVPTVQNGIKEQSGLLYDKETIHALILNAVGAITMETTMIMGMNVIKVNQKRTSEMSTVEFNQFKEQVQLHFGEKMGINIPEPIHDNFFNQMLKK